MGRGVREARGLRDRGGEGGADARARSIREGPGGRTCCTVTSTTPANAPTHARVLGSSLDAIAPPRPPEAPEPRRDRL